VALHRLVENRTSANSYTLGYVLQEGENPFNDEVWNTIDEKFLEQEIMVDKVKSFLEIHQDCSDCSSQV